MTLVGWISFLASRRSVIDTDFGNAEEGTGARRRTFPLSCIVDLCGKLLEWDKVDTLCSQLDEELIWLSYATSLPNL